MKAVILAGGYGTRISEESVSKPKPMVEIGGRPILWHIMKYYSEYGINDFIICCGYKSEILKEFFLNYSSHISDFTINLGTGGVEYHVRRGEPWKITLADTGLATMTGGRIKRIKRYLENEDTFCLTYGDGLSDVDIRKSIDFHLAHGRKATVTAVAPPGRFGALNLEGDKIKSFLEKPTGDGGQINGGFFVLNTDVFEYIDDDLTVWEKEPLQKLAEDKELMAFKHDGFWQPMDTLRDKNYLSSLWDKGEAPWKIWA